MDRLTFDAHIITTGAGSYRLRTSAARRQAAGSIPREKGNPP